MIKRLRWSKRALFAMLSIALPLSFHTYAQEEEEEEVYELSPFTIDASEEEGYLATTTLAGSRIRSNVRDLGASIAIVTEDFLEDTGATDGESLLYFVGNVEVGGVLGNFSKVWDDGVTTNTSRNNPQRSQRVRGLVDAVLTRDYFQSDVPFDAYNTTRVTVNRGPNSILFGLGSPGGVINNTTKQANIGTNFGELSVRLDHRGGHRESFDYNKTLIQDRLAVRVAMLNEQIQFRQEPAYEDDQRFYMAWDAILFENLDSQFLGQTIFRGNFEEITISRNPPDTVPPSDRYSSWFVGLGGQDVLNRALAQPGVTLANIGNNAVTQQEVLGAISAGLVTVPEGMTAEEYAAVEGRFIPKTVVNRFRNSGRNNTASGIPYFLFPAINYNSGDAGTQPGWDSPELAGIQGIMGRWRTNDGLKDLFWTNAATAGPGFLVPSIQNRNVFDYHKNLFQGTTNIVETDYEIQTFIVEQGLLGGYAGIEIAYDKQKRQQKRFNAFSSGDSKSIRLDISSHHAPGDIDYDGVGDRLVNENLGRPVIRWNDNTTTNERNEQETFRATIFGTLDLADMVEGTLGSILGSHTLTGLYEDRANDNSSRGTRGAWWADQGDYPGEGFISNGDNDNFRRIVKSQVYVGPAASGLNSPDQLRITDVLNMGFPQVGDTYGIWYYDNRGSVEDGVQNNWRIIEALQSANVSRTELESTALNLQSRFLDGHIVGMYAWREDEQRSFRRLQQTTVRGPTGSMAQRISDPGNNETDGNFNEALLFLEDTPFSVNKDSTTTWSIIGRYPENLLGELPWGMDISAHYYEAESFEPAGGQVNLLNQPLTSPFGTTEEYGFTVELFDSRLSLRFNWFETVNANARTNLAGNVNDVIGRVRFFIERIAEAEESGLTLFPSTQLRNDGSGLSDADLGFDTVPDNRQRTTGTDADLIGVNSYDEYYTRLINILPPEVQSIYNFEVIKNPNGTIDVFSTPLDGALWSTQNFVAEGMEIDVGGQITNNWSISLNVAQQETVTSDTGPVAIPLAFEILDRIIDQGLYDVRDSPFQVERGAIGASRYEGEIRAFRIEKAKDNTVSKEQREWRVNLVTRYDFLEGLLNGFSVGAGLRYQDSIATGYPNIFDEFGNAVPDILNPWLGPDELNGDLFFRYGRSIFDGNVDWTIQFNARNLYRQHGSQDIPVNASIDGTVAVIRIPNEQQFFLTNTFRF
ncbi:MAG: TonB-dependent receptor plug domain-containing protein [Opitutae bacterium]|nr:TonB-dependent receptor plug domain-containing protein [Opitutae bacterium]